jgi:hypothetical protein
VAKQSVSGESGKKHFHESAGLKLLETIVGQVKRLEGE